MRAPKLLLPIGLVLALLGGSARAQEPADPRPEPVDPAVDAAEVDGVTMDFDNVEIAEIIKVMAKLTHRRFLYDERVKGTVTIVSEKPVPPEEAFRMFESALQLKGFTIVEGSGGELKVIPTREAKQAPLEIQDDGELPARRDVFATRMIPLRYVKAGAIEPTLRQFASADASLIGDARTNTLIVTDTSANIAHMLDIIKQIDIPLFEEQVKVIQLTHASADEMTAQLREVFGAEERPGAPAPPPAQGTAPRESILRSRAAAAAAAAREAAAAAAGNAGAGGGDAGGQASGGLIGATSEPRFIPDARTNSILVMAPKTLMSQVEEIVTLLDYSRPGGGTINIYRLKNADAEEMAETLASLSGAGQGFSNTQATPQLQSPPGVGAGMSGGMGVGNTLASYNTQARNGAGASGGGGGGARAAVLDGDIRITAEGATNSLIIQGTQQQYDSLVPMIEKLDVRRPQVLIEGLVLEVQVDKGDALGTNLLYRTLFSGNQSLIGSNPGDALGGLGSTIASSAIGAKPVSVFSSTVIGAKTLKIPDPSHAGEFLELPVISAVIQATQNDDDTNVMAAPQILTADNAEAQIVVGENRPFPTQQIEAPGLVQSDPNRINPFQTSTQIERRDVGLKMRVTPQITEGDTVRMKLFAEISDVTSEGSGLGPTTNNRQIENTVYVNDGESVMIGGIIQDRMSKSESKVPLLGDLPLIGWLFGKTTNSVKKTNLLLLLTPHVVRGPKDLEQLTLERRERFRANSAEPDSPEDKEKRRRALEAGIDLPVDPNPVRRELDSHTERYPTERLPELREERQLQEDERQRELEEERRGKDSERLPDRSKDRSSRSGYPDPGADSELPRASAAPVPSGPAAPAGSPAPSGSPAPRSAARGDEAKPPQPQAALPADPAHAPKLEPEPQLSSPSRRSQYLVQIEPLEDAGAALALLAKLNGSGYAGSVVLQQQDERVLYTIRLGPYKSESDARKAGVAVEKQTKLDAFVMLGP